MNKFIFLGRLTKDPEFLTTSDLTKQISKFSIAVNRRFVPQGQERQADFFNLVAYGKTAEFCNKYFKKGQQVLIEGRIQNRSWEAQTGIKRYATDFIAEQVYFADSNERDEETANTNSVDGDFITIDNDEDLPF